jgi:predicted DNA-binding transcriptional regulator AlpA
MKIYRQKQLYGPGSKTGMSKGRFFYARKSGDFPPPNIRLSERFQGWTSDIVDAWIESKRSDRPRQDAGRQDAKQLGCASKI